MSNWPSLAARKSEVAGASAIAEMALPLVSIIVTAHNYARFLSSAVGSVFDQSYAAVECIVVDDGSSDDTPQVVAELQRAYPSLIAIRNETALGQGGASRAGFEASRGEYIVFLDGDDVLMPDFVRDHVFTHLSARTAVGFTSSDIYQVVNGRLVVSTCQPISDRMVAAPPTSPKRFRALAQAPSGPWPHDGPDPALLAGVRYVKPSNPVWCWSPMTANMFRRDALTLFIGHAEFDEMRLGSDTYLCMGVNSICGSFLIDKPLSIYRIHGGNAGASHAQLEGVRAMKPAAEWSDKARRLLIKYLTRNAVELSKRLWSAKPLLGALAVLEADIRGPDAGRFLRSCVASRRAELVEAAGEGRLNRWLLLLRLTPRLLRRIWLPPLFWRPRTPKVRREEPPTLASPPRRIAPYVIRP